VSVPVNDPEAVAIEVHEPAPYCASTTQLRDPDVPAI
jgi:hypothetical protein